MVFKLGMPGAPVSTAASAFCSLARRLCSRDLHGPGGPAGQARTGKTEAGRAHKPSQVFSFNGLGRASFVTGRNGPILILI